MSALRFHAAGRRIEEVVFLPGTFRYLVPGLSGSEILRDMTIASICDDVGDLPPYSCHSEENLAPFDIIATAFANVCKKMIFLTLRQIYI